LDRDQYLIISFGWQQTQHHVEIIQDKVWIQCDKFLPILFQLFSDNFFSFVFADKLQIRGYWQEFDERAPDLCRIYPLFADSLIPAYGVLKNRNFF
jgi:hypothetical protein